MGKNLPQQRRGKGTPAYRTYGHRFVAPAKHLALPGPLEGVVVDVVDCPGHTAPLMLINYAGHTVYNIAPEGIAVGDTVRVGEEAPLRPGNLLPLKSIPEGTEIYNVERLPGDGGKLVRSSGTFARIVAKTENEVVVRLPSNHEVSFLPDCRALVGIVAGSGRLEKPFLKAGAKWHAMRVRNKLYPVVSGVSKNALDHPFGGSSSHHKGRSTTTSRHAPPGRKVGLIAARRAGRKKK